MLLNEPKALEEVRHAFNAYEKALMEDDVVVMDSLFHASPLTVRFGVGEVLYGIDAIRAFRAGRGGSPPRTLSRVEIATYGDAATANAEFFREGSELRGRQSQTWIRFESGWKVVSAHVSIEGKTS